MKRIGRYFSLGCCLFLFPLIVKAQEITTELAESAVGEGDVFSIVVTVKSQGRQAPKVDVPSESRPTHRNIAFLRSSDNQSYHTSIINGQVSASTTIKKVLTYHAQRRGEVSIDSFPVTINGKRVMAPGIQFTIAKQSAGIQGKKNQGSSPFESMESLFSNFLGRRFDVLGRGQKASELDFFVDVEVSNMNPYRGEQFVVQWYLYTNGRITDIDSLKYPSLEGFWKEEISLAVTLRGEPVTRDGKDYTRYMLASYAVTPIVEDRAIIDTYEVKCVLTSLTAFMSNAPRKEAVRRSDEAILNIKPLPQPQPDQFSGLVGEFQLLASVDRRELVVGEPFTYTYKVTGIGQSKFMEPPELDFGPHFEVYNVAESSKFIPPNRTEKSYSYLLIPKNLKADEIKSFSNTFFDPVDEEYYTLETRPFGFNVSPGVLGSDASDDVERYADDNASEKNKAFAPSFYDKIGPNAKDFKISSIGPYVAFYLFAVCLLMGLLVYQHFDGRIVYNFEKDLNLRFEKLFSLVESGSWREASVEAVNIVYFFVNSRSRRISKSQKLEDILAALPPSLRREIEETLSDLNNDLQRFSFAPERLVIKGNEKDQVKEKCLALKQLFERSLRDEVKTS